MNDMYLKLTIITNIIIIILGIIVLTYIGWSFNQKKTDEELDDNDWKRKYIIFFAWIILLYNSVLILRLFIHINSMKSSILFTIPILFLFINIITSILLLIYFGINFDKKNIDITDWKRKYIIFFSYLAIFTCIFGLYQNIMYKTGFINFNSVYRINGVTIERFKMMV